MSAGKKFWKVLLKILGSLVFIAVLVLAAVSLILAKPSPEETESPAAAPSLAASPALEIKNETELYRLVASSPAPVMSFMSGSGMTFVSAVSSDTAVSGNLSVEFDPSFRKGVGAGMGPPRPRCPVPLDCPIIETVDESRFRAQNS